MLTPTAPPAGPARGDLPPLVSVCIITFQHARFIAQALNGVLMQKTSFPVEIVVGEDKSTDGTREICLDFARRYPSQIKVLLQEREPAWLIDGRRHGGANMIDTLRAARGKYIAICEGDDYWTDAGKLEQQVEFLRLNPDCIGCFHDASVVDEDGRVLRESYFESAAQKFSQRDVIGTLMSRYATCSLIFHARAVAKLPAWFLRRPCDLYLDILISSCGLLGFLQKNMAVYRRHAGGVWSGQREAQQVMELIVRYKLLLSDDFFLTNYRELLLEKIDEFQALLFTRADLAAELSRLESIVVEQTAALASSEKHLTSAQEAIDRLNRQVVELAATATKQSDYVGVLEAEQKRYVESDLAAKTQLEALSGTCKQQMEYITVLEAEKNRLGSELGEARAHAKEREQIEQLRSEAKHYVSVIEEQLAYIKILEAERDRLNGGGK